MWPTDKYFVFNTEDKVVKVIYILDGLEVQKDENFSIIGMSLQIG